MQPTHVVVDTRDGMTWAVGEDGQPMIEATAGRFAVKRNSELPPERRTYRVFRLIQEDPFTVHDGAGTLLRRFPDEQAAAEFISGRPGHEYGLFDLTGPADDW
jgi:hypothetical protein